jgi:phospholipid/cholesterol/gamma-HCH transport system substrate-binding protein
MQRNRLAAVGAFVILGLLLFAVGLFLIGDRRMLFTDTFEVYAEFRRISGLQNGANVRVAGMNAGEVETIHVPALPSAKFRVKLRLREDLHQLIRLDSLASIQNDGLVGNKFVQVESGSDESPQVPDRGTIRSREPFDLADMLQRVDETIDLVTETVTDIRGGVDEAMKTLLEMSTDAQTLVADVGKEVRAVTTSTRKVAEDIEGMVAGVRAGRGSMGKLVTDDAFYEHLKSIAAEAEQTVENLREASENAKDAINDFRGEEGSVHGVVADLQQSLASGRETLDGLAEATEALKRNFFFRGFFNRRGYFDLQDISVEEYRRGALETGDRRGLRVWVSAAVLFETGPDGEERLTDDGRRRLDSAMAPFLGRPRDTPFVFEGYAEGATTDVQFLLSRRRAQLVRDYVVAKFGLEARYVTTMAMGSEASGSPAGDRWSGVALAAFVPRESR